MPCAGADVEGWKQVTSRPAIKAVTWADDLSARAGLTTKVHLAVDGRGLPLSIVLTPGNANDAATFGQVLDAIRIPRPGAGRPRTTPDRVRGDKAYSSKAIRHLLRRRGIAATIPERRDQEANRRRRGALGGRPPTVHKETYRARNMVERCFARLKQFRAIATRFDKPADRYRAGVVLASLILWLREPARWSLSVSWLPLLGRSANGNAESFVGLIPPEYSFERNLRCLPHIRILVGEPAGDDRRVRHGVGAEDGETLDPCAPEHRILCRRSCDK